MFDPRLHNLNVTVPGTVGYPPQGWGSGPGDWKGDSSEDWMYSGGNTFPGTDLNSYHGIFDAGVSAGKHQK